MARPLTCAQALENRRFLAELAETGNARLAARMLGVNRSTYTKRRAKHVAFAKAWDEALAARGGKPQCREASAGRMSQADLASILARLSETNNIRLSAREAGFAHSSLLARARRDAAFARELRLAATIGRDRALLARMEAVERAREWISEIGELPPIPQMTVREAMLQLAYHRPAATRRARPLSASDPADARAEILAMIDAARRGRNYEETGSWRMPGE